MARVAWLGDFARQSTRDPCVNRAQHAAKQVQQLMVQSRTGLQLSEIHSEPCALYLNCTAMRRFERWNVQFGTGALFCPVQAEWCRRCCSRRSA